MISFVSRLSPSPFFLKIFVSTWLGESELCFRCNLTDRGGLALVSVIHGQGDKYLNRGWERYTSHYSAFAETFECRSLRKSELDNSVDSVLSAGVRSNSGFI